MAGVQHRLFMVGKVYLDRDLPKLARRARERMEKTIEDVARELGLSRDQVVEAETRAGAHLFDIQDRIIQRYTRYCVVPERRFRLHRK